MPRVPLPSVRPQEPQSGRFSAPQVAPVQNAAGQQIQQLGGALQQAGGAAVSIGTHLQQQFDLARAKEADNLASDVFREQMGAYLQTVGKGATGDTRTQTFESIREKLNEIGQSLGTPTQRALFREKVDARMQDALFKADKHEADQVFAYELSESKARAQAFRLDATNADPETDEFTTYHDNMLRELDGVADKLGLPADSAQRVALKLEETTKLHLGMVDRLLTEGKTQEAKTFYADYRDEIAAPAREQVEKTLKTAGVKDEAQTLHLNMLGQGLNPLQILQQSDDLYKSGKISVEVQDDLMRRVASREDFVASTKARAASQMLEQAKAKLLGGEHLSAQETEGLRTAGVLDQLRTWQGNGLTHKTSAAGYMLKQQAENNPESLFSSFRDENGQPSWDVAGKFLRGEMSDEHLGVVYEYWRQWRGLDPHDATAIDVDLMMTQALRDIGPDAGGLGPNFLKSTPSPTERAKIEAFTLAVQRDVNAHVRGRKAVSKDYEDAIARIKRNALKESGQLVPTKVATSDQLQDGVWATEFGDLPANHAYMNPKSPEYRAVRDALAAEKGGVENVYDIDIATEIKRQIDETNVETQQTRATALVNGEQMLQQIYSSTMSNTLQRLTNQREEWRQMLIDTDQPTVGIPHEEGVSAAELHVGVKENIMRQWGERLALQYGLTVEQMNKIIDKAGNYKPPTARREPQFGSAGTH